MYAKYCRPIIILSSIILEHDIIILKITFHLIHEVVATPTQYIATAGHVPTGSCRGVDAMSGEETN